MTESHGHFLTMPREPELKVHLKRPPQWEKPQGPGHRDVYVDARKVGEVWREDGYGWAWLTPATGGRGSGLRTRAEAVDEILIVN